MQSSSAQITDMAVFSTALISIYLSACSCKFKQPAAMANDSDLHYELFHAKNHYFSSTGICITLENRKKSVELRRADVSHNL